VAPPGDPLYRQPELSFVAEFAPTGIPLRVLSNQHEVVVSVEEALESWKDFPIAFEWKGSKPLIVRLICHDDGGGGPVVPIYRMPKENLLLIALGKNLALADRDTGDATAYVTPDLVEDQGAFRYSLLQAVLVFLLTPRDRIPVHAAAIVKGERALLFSGPPGVGKSTLALAAARSGYQVLADDAVYVQQRPALQIWGLSPYAHLPSFALQAFPGAEWMIVQGATGRKGKVLVDLRRGGYWPWPPAARSATLCTVARSEAEASLKPISLEQLSVRLLETLPTGFDLFREELRHMLLAWPQRLGWELSLPSQPHEVVPLVDLVFEQLSAP
jgi:hypothetical protein